MQHLIAGVNEVAYEAESMAERFSKIASRKRKKTSDAEKIALEFVKTTAKHACASKVNFEQKSIIFEDSDMSRSIKGNFCDWTIQGRPMYCPEAAFQFEANLPDREFLTRFSVSCNRCRPASNHAFHLYCSYCDEILSGSIAGPGGKIADHVVKIRHIVKEAVVQQQYFERKKSQISLEEFQKVLRYVSKLEQWAGAIRFKRQSDEMRELDQALRLFQQQIHEAIDPSHMVNAYQLSRIF